MQKKRVVEMPTAKRAMVTGLVFPMVPSPATVQQGEVAAMRKQSNPVVPTVQGF